MKANEYKMNRTSVQTCSSTDWLTDCTTNRLIEKNWCIYETLFWQKFLLFFFSWSRQSSESNSPSKSFRSKLGRSVLPRAPAKSNSPLKTTDCVLDEMTSQVQRLGSSKLFNQRRRSSVTETFRRSTASIKRKIFNSNGSVINKPLDHQEQDQLAKRISNY